MLPEANLFDSPCAVKNHPGEAAKRYIENAFRIKGRRLGSVKNAARKAGITLDEYVARVDAGLKRCIRCEQWKEVDAFNVDMTRWDHRYAQCAQCQNKQNSDRYVPVPPDQRMPMGPPRLDPRDGDKIQARHLINMDVQKGRRPHPNDLHCATCGHKGDDRRHEYHHHMGYAARHHYDVIPLCSSCHHEEH